MWTFEIDYDTPSGLEGYCTSPAESFSVALVQPPRTGQTLPPSRGVLGLIVTTLCPSSCLILTSQLPPITYTSVAQNSAFVWRDDATGAKTKHEDNYCRGSSQAPDRKCWKIYNEASLFRLDLV